MFPLLNQLRVSLNSRFNPLRLDADVALRGRCGTVLQEPLYKGNIIAVVLINLRGVPFAEAVGADVLIAKVVTALLEMLLDCISADRKQKVCVWDLVRVCIASQEAVDLIGNGELAALARLAAKSWAKTPPM